MLGRMGQHHAYYKNTVKDGNKNDTDEDYYFKGPWYQYPIGIGYMLRCVFFVCFPLDGNVLLTWTQL